MRVSQSGQLSPGSQNVSRQYVARSCNVQFIVSAASFISFNKSADILVVMSTRGYGYFIANTPVLNFFKKKQQPRSGETKTRGNGLVYKNIFPLFCFHLWAAFFVVCVSLFAIIS